MSKGVHFPLQGRLFVRSSQKTTPKAKMSPLALPFSDSNTSGAAQLMLYLGLVLLASAKSHSLGLSFLSSYRRVR